MAKLYDTPVKAIRKKCLDCSYWQPKEVRLCVVIDCPIYPYRLGHRPDEKTLKEFYEEKPEPTDGFSPKKTILSDG